MYFCVICVLTSSFVFLISHDGTDRSYMIFFKMWLLIKIWQKKAQMYLQTVNVGKNNPHKLSTANVCPDRQVLVRSLSLIRWIIALRHVQSAGWYHTMHTYRWKGTRPRANLSPAFTLISNHWHTNKYSLSVALFFIQPWIKFPKIYQHRQLCLTNTQSFRFEIQAVDMCLCMKRKESNMRTLPFTISRSIQFKSDSA